MTEIKKFKIPAPAIAIVVIVIGAIAAERWLIPSQSPPESPPPIPVAMKAKPETTPAPVTSAASQDVPVAKTWSTYHGGTDLSGFTDLQFPDKPAKLWQYLADGGIAQAPVADDKGIYFATTKGLVVSLDFQGKERWKKQLSKTNKQTKAESPERLQAPIACFRSTVFVGSMSGTVHALNADSGEERWTYDVGGEVLGTTNLFVPEKPEDAARLFVIERSEGALHCINADTGIAIWHTDAINRCDGSAAVANGTVVYGSCAAAFHIYQPLDGKLIRNVPLCSDCQVASGPAFVGDDMYSGSRAGYFYRVNVRTGQIVWTNQDSQKEIFTTPAISKNLVIFGSEDGGLYALDRETGKQKWRYDAHTTPTSPIIATDKVLVGAGGVLHALKLDSGEEVWKYEVSDSIASPSIINGMVVVGSEDGSVMAFGTKQS